MNTDTAGTLNLKISGGMDVLSVPNDSSPVLRYHVSAPHYEFTWIFDHASRQSTSLTFSEYRDGRWTVCWGEGPVPSNTVNCVTKQDAATVTSTVAAMLLLDGYMVDDFAATSPMAPFALVAEVDKVSPAAAAIVRDDLDLDHESDDQPAATSSDLEGGGEPVKGWLDPMTTGRPLIFQFRNGTSAEIAAVYKGGARQMYLYAVRGDDGNFVSFDPRHVPQLAGVIEAVSRRAETAVSALAVAIEAVMTSRAELLAVCDKPAT